MPRKPKPQTVPPLISLLIAKREAAGLSKRQLAACLGYSRDSIHGWELGTITPSYQSLVNWCSYFNMDLDAKEAGQ